MVCVKKREFSNHKDAEDELIVMEYDEDTDCCIREKENIAKKGKN